MRKLWNDWRLKRAVLVLLGAFIMVVFMQYTAHGQFSAVVKWLAHAPMYVVLTTVGVGGIYYIFASGFNYFIATIIMALISWVWGIINYLKYTMRSEYVTADDVISFFRGELTFTKEDVTLSRHLFYYGLVIVVLLLFSYVMQYFFAKKRGFKAKLKARLLHIVLGILAIGLVGGITYFSENLDDYMGDAEKLEAKYGLLLSFIPNNTLPHLVSTADYTPLFDGEYVRTGYESVKDIDGTASNTLTPANAQKKPNIIVIMSESLYDTDHFDNVKVDKNPMAVMHEIQQEYGGGSLAVDIFGGGTANTEYEFLTGLGHKYFASNLMYNNCIKDGHPSMVSYMKQMGYYTVAIHPYNAAFFHRQEVYDAFGFDETYFRENMTYTDDLFDVNISDYSLTKEIIEKYEQNKDRGEKPWFSFNVSVGAHKPCLDYDKGEPYEYTKKVTALPKNGNFNYHASMDIRRYYSAVYDANEAFGQLVEYFDKVEEPTVILLFGDHAPPLTDLAYDEITTKDLSEEELYQTPVVCWNNFGLEKFQVDNMNPNYLSAVFLSYLDFPLPKACVYNQNLLKYWYHTNTKKCVRDTKGQIIKEFDEEELYTEKASLMMYQNALEQKDDVKDIWDVPEK